MQEAFFESTQTALEMLTTLCDLIHPLTVSMWNTRSQVIGTYTVNPTATPHQIAAKYGLGSNIHGVNYRRVFVETPWETHEENIAWLFLNNIFPIFEGWLENLNRLSFPVSNGSLCTTSMQFPSSRTKGNCLQEIKRLTSTESILIKDAFYVKYSSKKHRCYSKLDNLLVALRYFKEMRNCYMHNNMIADQKLMDAYKAFSSLTSPSDFNMSEIPIHYPPSLGESVKLSLRGVIGFSHILIQIMVTVDSELLRSTYAETELIRRLTASVTSPILISSSKPRALRQIEGIFKTAGFISPDLKRFDSVLSLLIKHRIIFHVSPS